MPTLSLNGVTDLGNVHADTLNLRNATGTGYDEIKTLIAAGGGSGAVTSATSPLTITSGVLAINLTTYATAAALTTALALKQNSLVAGASITITGNTISFDNTLYFTGVQVALALAAYVSTASLNTLIANYSTTAQMNTALALKQNTLNFQTETAVATYIDLSNETASTPVYISGWSTSTGSFTNATGYQVINISGNAGVYKGYTSMTAGQTIYFQCDFKMSTVNHALLAVNNAVGWSGMEETLVTNLTTTAWTTVKWSFTVPSNGQFNMHIGHVGTGSSFGQGNGTVFIRNFSLTATPASTNFSERINVTGPIISQSTISCLSLVQTSDESIKTNIEDASLDDLKEIFDATEVKTYTRTDVPGKRLGFIAQDIQKKKPKDIGNLVFMTYEEDQPLLALDYSRLVTVLWGVCKSQQKQIDELIAKVNA